MRRYILPGLDTSTKRLISWLRRMRKVRRHGTSSIFENMVTVCFQLLSHNGIGSDILPTHITLQEEKDANRMRD
jgi:hypothetical protein